MNEEENGYYTSFDDYQSLEQQNKVYKDALEAIVKHQEIIGGSFSKYSSTHRIATEALK